ncbi:hypothetical protein [Microbacterium sp. T2.11-28]|uniref:hypothetical protein n=1 Tax=Microbacterium sp. T2.11-28 TaxID=3041169 RepID=UPI0024779FE7|nr:hypothetical protein [Microbacterium sp. T2.11-28]CAI9386588.1 hypothetical protein MICABA_00474 [Microbacterium sp. T2.11-28]
MGLFQQRPEEPSEWAGLPAEPWEPREPTEVLAERTAAFELPLFGDAPPRETIAYTIHTAEPASQATGGDHVDGDDAD